jgi:hypothetical protein
MGQEMGTAGKVAFFTGLAVGNQVLCQGIQLHWGIAYASNSYLLSKAGTTFWQDGV